MSDKEPESKPFERDGQGRFVEGTAAGPGRPKGSVNVATAQVRQAFETFVQANSAKMQELFDRVAADDPYKALDLMSKLAEYVLPKLARSETTSSGDADRPALVIRRTR